MSWSCQILTDIHDEDFNGIVRPSAILRYMQIAANGQLKYAGPSNEELRAEGKAFLLTAVDITLHHPVMPYTQVESTSCGCVGHGFLFPRYYELKDENGVFAEALSQFGLVNIATKELIPYNAYPSRFVPMELPAYTIKRFRLPHTEEMEKVGTYTVTYGQADQNHHLNNTYYPDLFAGFLDMTGKWVSRTVIRFQQEAPIGEVLTVYKVSEGDVHRFRTLRSDGLVNAEAELTLSDLN